MSPNLSEFELGLNFPRIKVLCDLSCDFGVSAVCMKVRIMGIRFECQGNGEFDIVFLLFLSGKPLRRFLFFTVCLEIDTH